MHGIVDVSGGDLVQAEVFSVCRSLQPNVVIPEGRFPFVIWVHSRPHHKLSACGLPGVLQQDPVETYRKAKITDRSPNGTYLCRCQLRFIE